MTDGLRDPRMPTDRKPRRLGVYSDGPFGLVTTSDGSTALVADAADHPFLTFACAVGRHFDETVIFARARSVGDAEDGRVLPREVRFVTLPYYESLTHAGQLARAIPGTVFGFWRGLGRVDTVWVFGPHPFALFLVPLARLRGREVVLGVRQDSMSYYRSRLAGRARRPVLALAKGWELAFRGLSRRLKTTVVGEDVARQYGAPRPEVLTMTVSLLRTADVAGATARDWSGAITLFTAGRIDQEKNPLLLVEAMSRLEQRAPGRFRLVWAGSGPLEGAVRERAAELGVEGSVELLGFVPFGPELLERYRSAHAFVHVSLTEGVPATVIEAMGSGTPIVATAVGGVPRALEEGRAGVLVPPRDVAALTDAILRLDADPALRERIVARGLQLARQNTLDASAERIARFMQAEGGE